MLRDFLPIGSAQINASQAYAPHPSLLTAKPSRRWATCLTRSSTLIGDWGRTCLQPESWADLAEETAAQTWARASGRSAITSIGNHQENVVEPIHELQAERQLGGGTLYLQLAGADLRLVLGKCRGHNGYENRHETEIHPLVAHVSSPNRRG